MLQPQHRDNDVAVTVEHVYKTFKLPHEKVTSVKGTLISLLRKGKQSYERQEVLNDVSFKIKKGEFFGIVGRNGSGKSTLLKMLAGIYTPDSGILKVNGTLTPFIELGVGFNPELTGRENVYLNGALLGFNRTEMSAMYDDIVMFAELEKFMDQTLKNYSSGMQVRLAFSIAIRARSDILLLDEVLAVGDSAFQKKCFDYFRELKKSNRTVVFISHDMNSIRQYCERVLVIDRGKSYGIHEPTDAAILYEELMDQKANEIPKKTFQKQLGDKQVTIDSVEEVSGKKVFKQGNDIELSITLSNHSSEPKSVVIGIGIADERGINMIGPNTDGVLPIVVDTTINLRVKLKQLPIAGNYKLNVGLFSDDLSETYHFRFDALDLKMLARDVKSSGGIYYYDNVDWSIS